MKRYIVLYILGVICSAFAVSCIDAPNFEPANPGDEVQFSLGLGHSAHTKTIYGDVVTENGVSKIKIEWSSNDKVAIYGVQCDRKSGEYLVTPSSNNPSSASAISKVGDAGVQWGTVPSEFYAIYPSSGATKFEEITENDIVTGVNVATQIRAEQTCRFTQNGETWSGTTILNDRTDEVMLDNIMYAYTPVPTDVTKGGYNVSLNFKPITTVLKFHLAGWEQVDDDDPNTVQTQLSDLNITRITLNAPVGLAGQFNLSIKGANTSVTNLSSTSNKIDIYPLVDNSYITIGQKEPMEFNVYCIPGNNIAIGEGWDITLTTNHGVFTYPLKSSTADAKTTLSPGKIHNLNIPIIPLSESDGSGTISGGDKNNWITRVEPTIYLSELSLPGAWYCYDSNYQTETSVDGLWRAGVRAFHIDCRATSSTLYCAGTETSNWLGLSGGTKVETIMSQIGSKVKSSGEYAVVILTIAEKRFKSGLTGQATSTIDPADILPLIKTLLDNNADKFALFTKQIGPDTSINEVLNHVIVKINVNTSTEKFISYASLPNAMMSEGSLASDSGEQHGDAALGTFTQMMNSHIYWGMNPETEASYDTGLEYYYIQAQKTTASRSTIDGEYPTSGTPSIGTRIVAINSIIDKSYEQYLSSSHNKWFQLGIGGNVGGNADYEDIAYYLNKHVYERIVQEKLVGEPSPVGIVLMNHCVNPTTAAPVADVGNTNDFYGPKLIDAILKLNDTFKMKRIGDTDKTEYKITAMHNIEVIPMKDSNGHNSGWIIRK